MDADRQTASPARPATGHPGAASALLEVMTEFRTVTSSRALVEQAPEVIARLGFDRVLVSWIDRGIWRPESMFVRHDPRWAAAIVQAGRDEPTPLDSVVETDLIASPSTFVVEEVQTHPRVCRPIAVVSRSENYGVAPIALERTVVGMVHADCYLQRRTVERGQRDALAVAAEGLAAHLSRLLLLERLQAVRDAAGHPWSALPDATPPPDPLPAPRADPARASRPPLTGRERDVMRLMAAGETNYRIARRLAVSEGTVKTHVSSILRKLDAANRAQAVSRWLDG